MHRTEICRPLLSLIIALTILTQSIAQSDQEIAIDSAIRAVTLSDIQDYKGKFRFVREYWDQLDDGIMHTAWRLYDKREKDVALTTLSRSNVILYAEVYKWEFNEDWDGEDLQYVWKYTTLDLSSSNGLDTLINFDHLAKLPNQFTFGYGCGAAGSIPEVGERMLEFVNDGNIEELDSWLHSFNPTLRAYAYLGFRLLDSRGKTLKPTTIEHMSKVATSTIRVYSCAGCTQWGYEPLYEVLSESNVERFLERYE